MKATMEDFNNAKTLAEIFLENGNSIQNIKVQQVRQEQKHVLYVGSFVLVEDRVPMYLMGIDEKKNVAFCYTDKTPNKIIRRSLDKIQWVVWRKNSPVPHYPAIYHYSSSNTSYSLSKTLYSSEWQARTGFGSRFIRLATEMEPFMLPETNSQGEF